jgi:DNA primase
MDTVMLAQHGIRNVVATLGTATTREHLALLFKSTHRVVFCFDGDRAGRAAAWRALEQALAEVHDGRECRFMFLPEGQDPDTLVQEIGADAFRARVEQALPLSEFLLAGLSKQVDLSTRDGRARLVGLAQPYLERLRDPALLQILTDELARRTRLAREDLHTALHRARAAAPREATAAAAAEWLDQPGSRPVRRALQLLLERPSLALRVQHLEQLSFSSLPGAELLLEAVEFFQNHPSLDASQLAEIWRGTSKGEALGRLFQLGVVLSDEGLEREFLDCIQRLRAASLRARLESFAEKARQQVLTAAETLEWQELTRQLSDVRLV